MAKVREYYAWIINQSLEVEKVFVTYTPRTRIVRDYNIFSEERTHYQYLNGRMTLFGPSPYRNHKAKIATGEFKTKKAAEKTLLRVMDIVIKARKEENRKDLADLRQKQKAIKRRAK